MTDPRTALRLAFVQAHLPHTDLIPLAGDASFRRYFRAGDYMLMDAPPPEDVRPFIKICTLLAPSVNVPDIIAQDIDNGFLLLQDFGDTQLADVIQTDKKEYYYQKSLEVLLDIQKINPVGIDDYHDKYESEMDLFTEWFLPYINVSIDKALWQNFKEEIIKDIAMQPKVLVHRDYHSRNLMIDGDSIGVIDFQDALVGAYTYDFISLIRDAYIVIDEKWVDEKIQQFYTMLKPDVSLSDFIHQVSIMGVQRNLKVLGIFVRLYKRDGKDKYLGDIAKVMHDLLWQLAYIDQHHVVYHEFLTFMKSILPKYQQKFAC